MKKFITVFVFFSYSVLADNISDFEIDGISIGDSLLDYYSVSEIENNTNYQIYDYMKEPKFISAGFNTNIDSKYDFIQFTFETNDTNKIIYGITGSIDYEGRISNCYEKLAQVSNELSFIFKNSSKIENKARKHPADPTGKSYGTQTYFYLDGDDIVSISCYDWSKEMETNDRFAISMWSYELHSWGSKNQEQ